MQSGKLREVERVEILTLQDNFIDLIVQDNSAVIQRAMSTAATAIKRSVLAEHGFATLITVTAQGQTRSMLFDFGFSAQGAARNADVLGADLTRVEALALSHGHMDHFGGLAALVPRTGKTGLPLVLHPQALGARRFSKTADGHAMALPTFTRQDAEAAGLQVVETQGPYPLLDRAVLFLGQIPRTTPFEKGSAKMCREVDGQVVPDALEDDSALVFHLRGRGLVVLSGCAHAGIVNTVKHARQVTGVEPVMAIMGGFHLSGQDEAAVIQPTIDALAAIDPAHIIPTHCSGRRAVQLIEQQLPDRFILNMSGTRLTFSA